MEVTMTTDRWLKEDMMMITGKLEDWSIDKCAEALDSGLNGSLKGLTKWLKIIKTVDKILHMTI